MKMRNSIKILTLAGVFLILGKSCPSLFAQNGDGGTSSLFTDGGVGARALSLGSAFVALSDDPTAVYWNPAGLDYIQKKSASFFYTGLDFGASYSFIGFAYPTLAIGAFGVGWARIGTDGVRQTDSNANTLGNGSLSENEFYFSYAKQIRSSLSMGGSLKLQRQSFSFGKVADTGIGLDIGLLYRPVFDNVLLSNFRFGLNFQNIIAPKIKLVERSVTTPYNIKAGLSKVLPFSDGSALRFVFDVDKGKTASSSMHVGTEYSFHDQANLRVGFNDGQVAFGAGARYGSFHIDYNYGSFFDGADFGAGHRLTITMDIGKTRTELARLAKERQERALQVRVGNELWFNAETDYNNSLESGRKKYRNLDYLGAFVDFSSALESAETMQEISMRLRGQTTDDPEANMRVETANSSIQEAQSYLALAEARSDSVRREEQKEIILQARQSAIEKDLRDFILEHKEKGIAFFKGGYYNRAINEWQLAVDRITNSNLTNLPSWVAEVKLQLESDIKTAEKQLKGNIRETIKKADALAGRGQFIQSLNVLNSIRGEGLSESERKQVNDRIRRYQNQLSFDQKYDEGVRLYARKEWKRAAEAFAAALKSRPGDAKAKRYFEDAQARAVATVQQMPPNLRVKYSRGVALYRQAKYQEALDIWEQIRLVQPYNKTILDAIDRARNRLRQ